MSYFSGEYECKMDAKGRVVLPAKVKACLPHETGNNIVLFKGFEECLELYSQLEWKKIIEKVSSLNQFDANNRKFQRSFLSRSIELELDNLGRFLIPKSMQQYAALNKVIKVIGSGNRVEIWNPDQYEQNLISDVSEYSKLAEKYLADD